MYLCRSVIEHPRSRSAEAYALMALMCFHASRTEARINTEGEIISLKDQNRSVWNSELISAGNDYLNKASGVSAMSPFHLEAAIAYEHCVARTYKDTNWKHIAGFYEQLLDLGRDPVIFLNYCIAIRELKDSATAIDLLESIKGDLKIRKYHLYHAFKGELLSDLGRTKESRISFEKAKQLSQSAREKNLLDRKMGFSH
jgi:RNA polymerase sigma-70 factor (ECF subfamily)